MKTLNLYYVYDKIGKCQIAGPIPADNDFVAALGFRDSFINNKAKNIPYSYKALQLVKFGTINVDENGCFSIPEQSNSLIEGSEIMDFIIEQCLQYGIDDNLPDDIKEVKTE